MDAQAVAERAWSLRVNLLRVALSILRHNADAEDAVSAAMLNAYRKAASLREEEKLDAWLMRILVRCCYDILRDHRQELPVEDMNAYDAPSLLGSGESVFEVIQTMPDAHRKVLVLFYYEGFKAREIAHILSLPLGTVLARLSRGRKRLRELLDEERVVHGDEQTV